MCAIKPEEESEEYLKMSGRLSKVDTLKAAIQYIKALSKTLIHQERTLHSGFANNCTILDSCFGEDYTFACQKELKITGNSDAFYERGSTGMYYKLSIQLQFLFIM